MKLYSSESQANAILRNQVNHLTANEKRHKKILNEVRAQYEATFEHLKKEHESMLDRIMAMNDDLVEYGRGKGNFQWSGEMRRYWKEHRWRKHFTGLLLTLRDES